MRLLKKIRAVSPVVGVILMVAITIVLAATIYLWVSSLTSPTKSAPQINFAFSYDKNTGNLTLTVISVQGSPTWNNLEVIVYENGAPKTVTWYLTYYNGTVTGNVTSTTDLPPKDVHAGDVLWTTSLGKVASGTTIKVQVTYVPSNSVVYTYTYTVP